MRQRITFGWFIHKIIVAAIGFVIGVVALVAIVAGTAKADTNQDIYLVTIHEANIHLADTDTEVQVAHAVCSDLTDGAGLIPEGLHLAAIWTDPTLTVSQASFIVGAASAAFCPSENPLTHPLVQEHGGWT